MKPLNDPKVIIQSLNLENRQLRQQVAMLSQQRSGQALFDKILAAATGGAAANASLIPKEAAQRAFEVTQEMMKLAFAEPEAIDPEART